MSRDLSTEELVDLWLNVDVNPNTRNEIITLHNEGNVDELEKRLRHRIQFGTAGLRSTMEAGFSRLNDVTILQASQGLSSYILQLSTNNTVVIGHDHRLNSKAFAEITATIFLLRGFKVYYLSSSLGQTDLVPTPLVPFAVDYFKAAAGIMITASHNPAADNGYKVYWSNGCQIIPPHDIGIANEILNNLIPIDNAHETAQVFQAALNQSQLIYTKEEVMTGYLLNLNSNVVKFKAPDVKFVYTPMHGVGLEPFSLAYRFLTDINDNRHHEDKFFHIVEDQSEPDNLFPTVKFPNPEEKGALDLAILKADSEGADLVLANDPDADRFSAAVKYNGEWRQLTGNELGYLFAEFIYSTYNGDYERLYFVNSTVSSQMIVAMTNILGLKHEETLTGFKWIGNKAIDLENSYADVPFGFEEAIGFMFKGIHDKDGIAAAIVFLQMSQKWKNEGTNAIEALNLGYEKYGYFKEYNSYYIVPEPSLTGKIFDNIRNLNHDGPYPESIGDYQVTYWRDLTTGYQSDTVDNQPTLPVDPGSQMITVKLLEYGGSSDEIRFTIRGSGTEPKLKVYIEVKSSSASLAAKQAKTVWDTLAIEWFKPEENGLKAA